MKAEVKGKLEAAEYMTILLYSFNSSKVSRELRRRAVDYRCVSLPEMA